MFKDFEIAPTLLNIDYELRGALPQRAHQLALEGRQIIHAHIGNPQLLGQKSPELVGRLFSAWLSESSHSPRGCKSYEEDNESDLFIEKKLGEFRSLFPYGPGPYSESAGSLKVRVKVAQFISHRDQIPTGRVKPEQIFLLNGASEGIAWLIELLLAQKGDGLLIPVPQYPLYSALIKKGGGVPLRYYLDEENGWKISREILEEALAKGEKMGIRARGLVLINPGNPTGGNLTAEEINQVLDFALQHQIPIIADEVYQENLYSTPFTSVSSQLGERPIPLFSLHSTSKGYLGACGFRGGYLEIRNPPLLKEKGFQFLDIMGKLAALRLSPNSFGQLLTYLMVDPPTPKSLPGGGFFKERREILKGLAKNRDMVLKGFSQMEGLTCQGGLGGMYLFPSLDLQSRGGTDYDYCLGLLEQTGLCLLNGSVFGQKGGTFHARIAFLPKPTELARGMDGWIHYHNSFQKKANPSFHL